MTDLVCLDGSVLSLLPVPVLDRSGAPYEATLRMLRDGAAFGEVGERCAGRLAEAAVRLREARQAQGAEAFPETGDQAALRGLDGCSVALRRALPRDRELLSLRARDPDDLPCPGELRVWLRDEHRWCAGADGRRGSWSLRSRAIVDAWGAGGTGVRCVLDSTALLAQLDGLLAACACVGALDPAAWAAGGAAAARARV